MNRFARKYRVSTLVCSAGPWTVAILPGSVVGRFEPLGWVEDDDLAGTGGRRQTRATVSVVRDMGGIRPRALVAGEFTPNSSGSFKVRVARSGELPEHADHDCPGLIGSDLVAGLPDEFAHTVVDGLVRFSPGLNRSGVLQVLGGGFDEVDSSAFAFEHAAGLLKWALLGLRSEGTTADLENFLADWSGR